MGNLYIASTCCPVCDVLNFGINLGTLIKPFFYRFSHLGNCPPDNFPLYGSPYDNYPSHFCPQDNHPWIISPGKLPLGNFSYTKSPRTITFRIFGPRTITPDKLPPGHTDIWPYCPREIGPYEIPQGELPLGFFPSGNYAWIVPPLDNYLTKNSFV